METIRKIKAILESRNMSQSDLAREAELAVATVNRIFNGKQKLTPNTLQKIADTLDVSVNDIMDWQYDINDNAGVSGYLEYDGEITKIKTLKQLEAYCEKIRFETTTLPKHVKEIRRINKENGKLIKISKPNANYDMNVNLREEAMYDASKLDVWAFKNANDVRDGIVLDFGNQCSGYGFEMNGHYFHTSENAYLCGQFSLDTPECANVQKQLIREPNGYMAKKKIKNTNVELIRKDWEEFNAEWMLYVIWCKVKGNQAFADKLRSIPNDVILSENSTTIHEGTSVLWGTKNYQIEEARDKVGRFTELQIKKRRAKGEKITKEEADKEIQAARDEIQYVGVYDLGRNYMGKILKICQKALLSGTEPDIPYDLFREKGVYLLGEKIF